MIELIIGFIIIVLLVSINNNIGKGNKIKKDIENNIFEIKEFLFNNK